MFTYLHSLSQLKMVFNPREKYLKTESMVPNIDTKRYKNVHNL